MCFTFYSKLPIRKSYLTHYLGEAMVCVGPVVYISVKIWENLEKLIILTYETELLSLYELIKSKTYSF